MLKKDYDKLKKAHKALIAREYQDLPLVLPPQVEVASEIYQSSSNGYGKYFYSGICVSLLVVLLLVV